MPQDIDLVADVRSGGSIADVLRERADSLARESVDEQATDVVSFLLFRIGDEWYAIPVGSVREIYQEYDVTQIPCVPSHILGVVNVRGEILSVTDPATLMSIGEIKGQDGQQPPAIVVVHEDIVTALVVDEIGDIVEATSAQVEPPIATIDRKQAEYITGSLHFDHTIVGLVSVERVLEPITTARKL